MKNGATNWNNPKVYYKLWQDLETFRVYFDLITDIPLKEIDANFSRLLSRIINYAKETNLDYDDLYRTRKIPEMMDLVHLAVADMAGAIFFITADVKFDFIGEIPELPFKNLSVIIVLDRTNDFKEKKRICIQHATGSQL